MSEANLSLAKAIEFGLSSEAAEKNAQELKGAEQLHVGQAAQASTNGTLAVGVQLKHPLSYHSSP